MFVKFSVQNFRSIFGNQELSLVSSNPRERLDSAISVGQPIGSVLRVAAIYGANASGKTNILRALKFFQSAVRNSQRRWEPEEPIPVDRFAFGDESELPTRMSLDFLLNGVRYEYGFTLDGRIFLTEWLHAYTSGRKQVWLDRVEGRDIKFGPALQTAGNRELNNAIPKLVRPNSLVLSAAVQNNYEHLNPIYNAITKNLVGLLESRETLVDSTARISFTEPNLKTRIARLMRAADLGIVDYDFVEEEMEEQMQITLSAMFEALPAPKNGDKPKAPFKMPKVSFFHQASEGRRVKLDASDESAGTLAYFGLMGPVCEALENGQLIFIDEIESSLHPNLAALIVQLFNNPRTNQNNAQLIFTTHEVTLLTDCSLRRDQIWFTEKDRVGATTLFPLSDFHLRKDDKITKGYLQGRFGGVPNVDQLLAMETFEAEATR
jgi:uncharacterized protein